MAPEFVTTNVTGTPAGTVVEASSIVKLSESVTSIRCGAALAEAAGLEGDAVAPAPEQAATMRMSTGKVVRWRRRMGLLVADGWW